jgi:hypothetical protein
MGWMSNQLGGVKAAAQKAANDTKNAFKGTAGWAKSKWGDVKRGAQQAAAKTAAAFEKGKKILAVAACAAGAGLHALRDKLAATGNILSDAAKKLLHKVKDGLVAGFNRLVNGKRPNDRMPSLPIDQLNSKNKKRAEESAKYSQQQVSKDSCALMSTRSILLEKNGKAPSEDGMKTLGEESGGYRSCRGTSDEGAVLKKAGIPSTTYGKPKLSEIANAVDAGKTVVVGYDTRPVWGLKDPDPAGHAVRVTGAERDKNGNVVALYVNDSGNGKAPEKIPAATFQKALDGFGGGRATISNSPVFPPTK